MTLKIAKRVLTGALDALGLKKTALRYKTDVPGLRKMATSTYAKAEAASRKARAANKAAGSKPIKRKPIRPKRGYQAPKGKGGGKEKQIAKATRGTSTREQEKLKRMSRPTANTQIKKPMKPSSDYHRKYGKARDRDLGDEY